MNISLLETARRNRIVALENLRIKKQVSEGSGQVLNLQTMREKMKTQPMFKTARMHHFEERRAA